MALGGDRLIARGPLASEVFDAAEADGAYLPLVAFVEQLVKVSAASEEPRAAAGGSPPQ